MTRWLRRATLAAFVLGLGLAAAGSPPASAQRLPIDGDRPAREVATEIEKTWRVIRHAEEVVRHGGGPEAKRLLESAIERQRQAEEHLRGDRRAAAFSLTRLARQLAQKAIDRSDSVFRGKDQIQGELRKTDVLLETARRAVGPGAPEAAAQLLRVAAREQEKAWQSYREERFRLALKLTLMAGDLARRAMRASDETGSMDDARALEILRRTDELIADISSRPGVPEDPAGRNALDQARVLQERAREAAARGNMEAAVRLSLTARDRILRASGGQDPEREEGALRRFAATVGALVEEAGGAARGCPDPRGVDLAAKAENALSKGLDLLEAGRLGPALGALKAAESASLRCLERCGSGAR
jgi:hypothetical protein